MPTPEYDVAVVGSGPNGLTAAAYLARAGARVVMLEQRFERGGTLATDDYSTPFQYNLAQFELPLAEELPPYRDLDLRSQGIRFVKPEIAFGAALGPGEEELAIGRGGAGLGRAVEELLAEASTKVAPLLHRAPAAGGPPSIALADLTPRELADRAADPRAAVALRYACGMTGFLDGAAPLGAIGAYCVARLFSPSIVVGGSKNLANGLARAALSAGARGLLACGVTRIAGAGEGLYVRVADGREIAARAVVSTLDPRSTFLELLAPELVPAELRDAAADWVADATGPFTAHFGIKGDPPAPIRPGADALIRVFGFASARAVDDRLAAALAAELPGAVAGHLTAVSSHDPLQASPGPYGPLHTLRMQTSVPLAPGGRVWDRLRTSYRARCWDALVESFPELARARLLFQFCDTPRDVARRFGTSPGGSVRQGALVPQQTLARRPHPSCSTGRTPIPGLYLGGGSVHPGVPGSLGGGYNVAGVVAEDLGLERWWPADAG